MSDTGPSIDKPTPSPESATGDSAAPARSAPGAPPARPRRGLGSLRSMVISMVVVALAVLAWWAFVPRSDQNTQQPVADVAGIAREVGISQHWDPAVADGLPKGWQAVNVTLVTASQPHTWQAGYDAPGGKYARVLQTKDGSSAWVHDQTSATSSNGSVVVDGVRWAKRERPTGGERSLVRSKPLAGLATVVTGTGDWSQLQEFAASLKPLSKSTLATKAPKNSAS